jgi:hypothetical protein
MSRKIRRLVILSAAKDLCNSACAAASAGRNMPPARKGCGPESQRTVLFARFTVTWSYCVVFFGVVVDVTSTWNMVAVKVAVLP